MAYNSPDGLRDDDPADPRNQNYPDAEMCPICGEIAVYPSGDDLDPYKICDSCGARERLENVPICTQCAEVRPKIVPFRDGLFRAECPCGCCAMAADSREEARENWYMLN